MNVAICKTVEHAASLFSVGQKL